ncbi:DeoR/GlpR transcriptional regulator [Leucobacter weissii]|uniref:DeoR/GlpR transcriptional regulator n=1 Tax=Leucobacter weissii TaxID=1983706 RepID=A0A939MHY5_9MICO|nr:DeoR/GlpR family DNA-binding transcription regulator [Leucobacter weissii]MBO1901073.1 DeoR/GlpR transcriptional regulator [Leucobacter weissii]
MVRSAEPRDERILALLEERERVSVGELAAVLGVSEVTVRKDLDTLARNSLVERIRGGARLRSAEEGPLTVRLGHRVAAKRAVARRAAELVEPGAVIAIDSSSTGYYLALELSGRADATVVTNSLRVATQLGEQSGVDLVLLGGSVRRTSYSTVGFPPELLRGFGRIDLAFFGVSALSVDRGLLERSFSEAETKRSIASASARVVALFDSSKTEGFGQHDVVPAGQVHRLVTDEGFDDAEAERWRDLGAAVDRVPLPVHRAD